MRVAASSAQFRHKPLDVERSNIRLFKIVLRAEGIHLELDHAELSAQHTAVSYVWGPPSPAQQIRINGSRFRVRQNLFDFLFEMKKRKGDELFWVDALCIDQENDVERTSQVRQMYRMYREAKRVYLWLGV